MKNKLFAFISLCIFLFLLAGCGASDAQIAAAIAQTEAARPTNTSTPVPTATPTPIPTPTYTPEPSPTPIVLPDVLEQTFSGISIKHRDSFEYVLEGLLPNGWTCEVKYAGRVTTGNEFKIQPKSGTVCYYHQEKIVPNMGVYFTFMYSGEENTFTFGVDALDENGQQIKGKGFYSVAMHMQRKDLSAHIIEYTFTGTGYFKGDLRLEENRWYNYALGFDDNDNYIIKIWDVENPELQLSYVRNWKDFPQDYIFISWISENRTILMDDFTLFEFEKLNIE